jgi:hypothetical protein
MLCPTCGEEFPWHVTVCSTCGVDLVDRLPGPEPTPDAELVRVFVTGDAGLLPVAKSLLEGEAIDYFVRGEGLQDLFGWGRLGAGFNYIVGPAEFWVRADDADRARGLLEGLISKPDDPPVPGDEESSA